MSLHELLVLTEEALFLGPPRAQEIGEAHHARSVFPPPPTTFQGAVRTRILRALDVDLADRGAIRSAVGPPESLPSGWSLDGPWVAAVVERDGAERTLPWVVVPACVAAKVYEPRPRGLLREPPSPPDLTLLRSEHRGPALLDQDAPPDLPVLPPDYEVTNGWIDADTLLALLSGRTTSAHVPPLPPFVHREIRSGLTLDDATRTAERSLLYFRETWRMGAVPSASDRVLRAGLAATLAVPDGISLDKSVLTRGTLRLGRRSRPLPLQPLPPTVSAWQDLTSGQHLHDLPDSALVGEPLEVWLVLASPVSLPVSDRDGTPARPVLPGVSGVRFEVRAAILPHPVTFGGLDATTGAPKPNRAFLQPGSAWRVRIVGGAPAARRAALLSLHHRCTLGPEQERTFGCGRTWVTVPTPATERTA